jgi:hypothetical protein
MAGVNLSQSASLAQGNKKKQMFASSGLPFSIILLVVTLVGWGGLRWYIHTVDKKITALESALATDNSRLMGESINRVADFGARMMLVGADPAELVDPKSILEKLESLVVPQVTLVQYTHDDAGQISTIAGKTTNFRYLAEQVISLKSDPLFSRVRVGEIDRDEEGVIEFTLINNL